MLESPISEEEVWSTIKSLLANKAPGLDGFIGRFYKACWDIIKENIMAVVSAVWRRDFRNFRLLNMPYITLIPKKDDATQPGDFRPISLIHRFAKLLMKILANRLAARLDSLVPKNQSDFIKRRFIQDNFMLVQQTSRFLHAPTQPRAMLKLDITKAFDSVSWTFLMEVLEKLGFGRIWRDIVSRMLATSSGLRRAVGESRPSRSWSSGASLVMGAVGAPRLPLAVGPHRLNCLVLLATAEHHLCGPLP
jgi:hypothetical protein